MVFSEVLQRFVEKSPVSVMFRATLENMVTAEWWMRSSSRRPGGSTRTNCCSLLWSTC